MDSVLLQRISHVCSRWRSVAISTCHLWNQIFIHDSSSIDQVKTCIARSKTKPLRIDVHIHVRDARADLLALVLDKYLPRVEWLNYYSEGDPLMRNVVARLDGKNAPLLLRLRLVNNAGPDWEGGTVTTTPPVLFAPKLDTLVLGHIPWLEAIYVVELLKDIGTVLRRTQ